MEIWLMIATAELLDSRYFALACVVVSVILLGLIIFILAKWHKQNFWDRRR